MPKGVKGFQKKVAVVEPDKPEIAMPLVVSQDKGPVQVDPYNKSPVARQDRRN